MFFLFWYAVVNESTYDHDGGDVETWHFYAMPNN